MGFYFRMARKFVSQFKLVNKQEQLRIQESGSTATATPFLRPSFNPSFKWMPQAGGSSPGGLHHTLPPPLNGFRSHSTPMLESLVRSSTTPEILHKPEEDNFHNFTPTTSILDICARPQQCNGRSFPAKTRHFDDSRGGWAMSARGRRNSPESSSASDSISPTFGNYDDGASSKFHLSKGGLQLRRVRRSTTGSDVTFSDLLSQTDRRKPIDYLKKRASEVLWRSKRIASGQRPTIASGVCFAFNQDQFCPKGSLCRFTHGNQINKEPLCARLLRGQCRLGAECSLSHELSPEQMPICDFFLRGMCTSYECPYAHVKFGRSTLPCKAFERGYCPLGRMCSRPHIYPPSLWRRRGADAPKTLKREVRRKARKEVPIVDCSPKRPKLEVPSSGGGSLDELPDFIPIQDSNSDCSDVSGDESDADA